jgi:putative PIN family toxin of toxin-antitoxin system
LRLVVDTNVLVSALLSGSSLPGHLLALWREGRFDLVTGLSQLDEVARVLRYPRIRVHLAAGVAGRLMNDLRNKSLVVSRAVRVDLSPDPDDNEILGIAVAGRADVLVTGDRRDLLSLRRVEATRILAVREFLAAMRMLP